MVPGRSNTHPGPGVTLIGMMPAGSAAVSETFVAVSGPLLETVAV